MSLAEALFDNKVDMFTQKRRTGLDIGTDRIKLAAVSSDGKTATELHDAPIISERTSRTETLTDEAWLCRVETVIKSYLQMYPGASREFDLSLPGESMSYRYVELPRLKKQEVELAVTSQAYKLLPISASTATVTSVEVPPLKTDSEVTAALVTAVESKTLDKMRRVLERCGTTAGRVEVPILSLTRELYHNHRLDQDRFYALVHVGFRFTRVSVSRAGFPYFAREFELAGRDFTYAVQMSEQCSWAEAEALKIRCDLRDDTCGLEPFVLRWLDDVRRSLAALKSRAPDEVIDRVFISGGSAALKGLTHRLSAHLSVPVEIDTWDRIEGPTPGASPPALYKVAVGVGLDR